MFGATQSSPLFGASSPSFGTPLYGVASSQSLFGSAQSPNSQPGTPHATQSGGFLLGASPLGAASTSLFGASPFGQTTQSSAAFGVPSIGGLTGFKPLQAAPPFSSSSLFAAVQPASSTAGTGAATAQAGDAVKVQRIAEEQHQILRRIKETQEACCTTLPTAQMTHLFLYKTDPSQRTRPIGIPEAQWQHALKLAGGPDNSDGLWPVAIRGLTELQRHQEAQQSALQENADYVLRIGGMLQALKSAQNHDIWQRMQRVIDQHAHASQRLLRVVKMIDMLHRRLASPSEIAAVDVRVHDLSRQLNYAELRLASNNMSGLKHLVNMLVAAIEMQVGNRPAAGLGSSVDMESLEKASKLISEHNVGVATLQAHLHRVVRDVNVIKEARKPRTIMVLG